MNTLPGEQLCKKHQGNHSHYAEENCSVCILEEAIVSALEGEKLAGGSRDENGLWQYPDLRFVQRTLERALMKVRKTRSANERLTSSTA